MSEIKEFILNDEEYLSSLLADINKSKNSIDLEVYIFENDSAGKMVADALCHAAHRGVKIRVLVDGVGSITWGGKITTQMESSRIETRIETRIFHPLPWKFMHWHRSNYLNEFLITKIYYFLSKINSRDHRKVCIIDKSILYIGSANINDHLLVRENYEKKWRDTTIKITGNHTDEIQYAFDRAWNHLPFEKILRGIFKKKTNGSVFHLNYSWRLRRKFYKLLLRKMSYCKKRIWITNAYFVPDSNLLNKLITASKNGIDVRILLPGKSDIFFMSIISNTFYDSLLKSGVSIYEYTPSILHAKILILDDWFSIGSRNLNYRSFLHDLEVDVEIRTDEAKDSIERKFLSDISQSHKIQLGDLKNQPVYKKLLGKLMLLIRYWL